MEMKQIRELMRAMGQTGIKTLTLKEKDFEIHLEREGETVYQYVEQRGGHLSHDDNPMREELEQHRASISVARQDPRLTKGKEIAEEGIFITSPMVGTFYGCSSPGEASFVKKGDRIEANTIVCIVEAMKVMNEIKAGVTGTVEEVMVVDGEPVEFGTPLYRIV